MPCLVAAAPSNTAKAPAHAKYPEQHVLVQQHMDENPWNQRGGDGMLLMHTVVLYMLCVHACGCSLQ